MNNALRFINPFDEDFFVYKLLELLGDMLKALFVPSEDSINNLVNSVKAPFAFIDTIHENVVVINEMFENPKTLPKITININQNKYFAGGTLTVIDLSWYAPYKEYGDNIISAFIYVFFFWRIFVNLPNIISGSGGGINESSIAFSDIQAYNKFGFGRRSSLTRRQR